MIWHIFHIFRKDLRISWKPALAAAILQWIGAALIVKEGIFSLGQSLESLNAIVSDATEIATFLAIITVVHNDGLALPSADWLMRPIRRRDMLLAKLLFFVAVVQLPTLVGRTGAGIALGFGFGDSFRLALWQSAVMTLAVGLSVVAAGAMTATLLEAAIYLVIVFSIAAGQTWLAFTLGSSHEELARLDWIRSTWLSGGVSVAGVVALGLVYRWRKVALARFASLAIFALGAACAFLPWKAAYALQRLGKPPTGAAQRLQLRFDTAARNSTVSPFRDSTFLPVRATGLDPGMDLITDRVEVKLTLPNGSVEHPKTYLSRFSAGLGSLGIAYNARARVNVSADYWLTLVKETGDYQIEVSDPDTLIPALGRCRLRLRPENGSEEFGCISTGSFNGIRYSLADEDWKGELEPACISYAPHWLWLVDRDPFSRTGSEISPGRRVPERIKTYQIVEHFVRHLEIPNVRLEDWRQK